MRVELPSLYKKNFFKLVTLLIGLQGICPKNLKHIQLSDIMLQLKATWIVANRIYFTWSMETQGYYVHKHNKDSVEWLSAAH